MLNKHYLCAVVKQEAMLGLPAPANWPTIQARDYRSVTGNEMSQRDNAMQNLNVAVTLLGLPAPANPSTNGNRQESLAKLNPRWVETLMGLPVGWTMPSCASPVTIAPTNSDCLETELFPQPQPELS
jgi:hypothetical protein